MLISQVVVVYSVVNEFTDSDKKKNIYYIAFTFQ